MYLGINSRKINILMRQLSNKSKAFLLTLVQPIWLQSCWHNCKAQCHHKKSEHWGPLPKKDWGMVQIMPTTLFHSFRWISWSNSLKRSKTAISKKWTYSSLPQFQVWLNNHILTTSIFPKDYQIVFSDLIKQNYI